MIMCQLYTQALAFEKSSSNAKKYDYKKVSVVFFGFYFFRFF